MVRMLFALAVIGVLGFLGYKELVGTDAPKVAPVQVNVEMPNPLGGGEAPEGDQIYIP